MADSPAESILDAIVDQLRGDNIDLTGVTGAPGVPDSHVIATTVPYDRDARQRFAAAIPRPAVIVSTARKVDITPAAGSNCHYVAMYTFLIQILHTELDLKVTAITKSIQKWEYQIRNYLHMSNLRQAADEESNNWMITLTPVSDVDLRDEREFALFDDAVAVIPFRAKSTENINTDGRT